MDTPIDIVVTWVDGSDSEWLAEKEKYKNFLTNEEGNNAARYRDWGTLKYVLRSIDKNMPWVNKIFLVTAGHSPNWLVKHEKIILVTHQEFIPKEFLPTFSSHVIESFLHKIPNLSEQFIYFNDDTLVLKPAKETDFFLNGKPCDYASLHIHAVKKSSMIHQIATNAMSIINEHFDIDSVLKNQFEKWFTVKYKLSQVLKTLVLSRTPRFPGIEQPHMPQPYLKSTFIEVWEKEKDFLLEVATHKFRDKNDVNQWLFRNWQLVSGNFEPVQQRNRSLMIDFEKNDELEELRKCELELKRKRLLLLCINDGDNIQNQEQIVAGVNSSLQLAFPETAPWEQ